MDENEEVKRIWEQTEQRLSALSGEQTREYEITTGVYTGKTVSIPVDAGEDDILQILQDEKYLCDEDIFEISGCGEDEEITVSHDNVDDIEVVDITLKTYEEIELFDEFTENILDIHREQYLSEGQWVTSEYTCVTGTGGPHIEFTTGYVINVYWGGKSQECTTYDDNARATIDRVEEWLNECFGGE